MFFGPNTNILVTHRSGWFGWQGATVVENRTVYERTVDGGTEGERAGGRKQVVEADYARHITPSTHFHPDALFWFLHLWSNKSKEIFKEFPQPNRH